MTIEQLLEMEPEQLKAWLQANKDSHVLFKKEVGEVDERGQLLQCEIDFENNVLLIAMNAEYLVQSAKDITLRQVNDQEDLMRALRDDVLCEGEQTSRFEYFVYGVCEDEEQNCDSTVFV